jgi:hypothetical protein
MSSDPCELPIEIRSVICDDYWRRDPNDKRTRLWDEYPHVNIALLPHPLVDHEDSCAHPNSDFCNKRCEMDQLRLFLSGFNDADIRNFMERSPIEIRGVICDEYREVCKHLHVLATELNAECSNNCYLCINGAIDIKDPGYD